jgi:hypothetical protein
MAQERVTRGLELESVIINSSRFLNQSGINIYGLVTDIEIFEHLDLPYLTGQIALVDSERLFDRLDLQGAEYITVKVKQSKEDNSIEKRFVIDRVINVTKINETSELITLHFIEDIAIDSRLYNVNRSYNGSPIKILSSIAADYLNKEIDFINEETFQQKLKVIIPNLEPLSAMAWIKNRATTFEGSPYYLFSTFIGNKLNFIDLKSIIEQQPINTKSPFVHGVNYNSTENVNGFRYYPIKSYSYNENDDMYSLIGRGLIGAQYNYYNSGTGVNQKTIFTIEESLSQIENSATKRNTYADDLTINDIKLGSFNSRKIYQISQSGAYNDGTDRFRSYDQENVASDHKKKVIGRSLKHLLLKDSLTIRIPGHGFLENTHRTIGNILRVGFKANRPGGNNVNFDLKKSGDYIIYACKHDIRSENYDLEIKCVKLTSFTDDTVLRSAL